MIQKELLIENILNNYFEIINDDILLEGIMDIPKEKAIGYLKDIKKKIDKNDLSGLKNIVNKIPKINTDKIISKIQIKNSKFKKLNSIAYNKLKSIMPEGTNDELIKTSGSLMVMKASLSKNPEQSINKDSIKVKKEIDKSLSDEYYQQELDKEKRKKKGQRIGAIIILINIVAPLATILITGSASATFGVMIAMPILLFIFLFFGLIYNLIRVSFGKEKI